MKEIISKFNALAVPGAKALTGKIMYAAPYIMEKMTISNGVGVILTLNGVIIPNGVEAILTLEGGKFGSYLGPCFGTGIGFVVGGPVGASCGYGLGNIIGIGAGVVCGNKFGKFIANKIRNKSKEDFHRVGASQIYRDIEEKVDYEENL